MKQCTACRQHKSKDNYYTKKRSKLRKDGSIHSWVGLYAKCKPCTDRQNEASKHKYKDWYKQYRVDNKERISERGKAFYTKQKDNWWTLASTLIKLVCKDCGYNKHSAGLEFNHIDPKEKEYNIHYLMKRPFNEKWIKLFKAEIQKCEILCATCHKVHHAKYNFLEKSLKSGKKND